MILSTNDSELYRKYFDGVISYEDALKKADSINILRLAIKLRSGPRRRDDDGNVPEDTHDDPKNPNPSLNGQVQVDPQNGYTESGGDK